MLRITLGDTKPVVFRIEGHSDVNGAVIAEGSTITLSSNDPTIGTVPDTFTVPAGGAKSLDVPVTVTQVEGSTDIKATVVTPEGTFEIADTLVVSGAAPAPLTHVTGALLQP